MKTCTAIDPLVTPFVDGELPGDDRSRVEQHIRVCPPCHSRVDAERSVRELIQENRHSLCASRAPEGLHKACAQYARLKASRSILLRRFGARSLQGSDLRSLQASAPLPWRARLTPYALAASLVVIVGGAFVYQATNRSTRLLAAELTADHLKCFAINAALRTHQNPAAVESSMMSSFGWRAHLPENATRAGLELVGARPCLYGMGKIAHIMYRHEGRPVSLFMLPGAARASELVEVLGHEAAIWCVGNRTFVLLAREPRPDVKRLAEFIQAGLQ